MLGEPTGAVSGMGEEGRFRKPAASRIAAGFPLKHVSRKCAAVSTAWRVNPCALGFSLLPDSTWPNLLRVPKDRNRSLQQLQRPDAGVCRLLDMLPKVGEGRVGAREPEARPHQHRIVTQRHRRLTKHC